MGSDLEQQATVCRTQLAPHCSVAQLMGQTPQHHQQQMIAMCRWLSRSCAKAVCSILWLRGRPDVRPHHTAKG